MPARKSASRRARRGEQVARQVPLYSHRQMAEAKLAALLTKATRALVSSARDQETCKTPFWTWQRAGPDPIGNSIACQIASIHALSDDATPQPLDCSFIRLLEMYTK